MKLTFQSPFRQTTESVTAASDAGLPQHSLGFRAMALLTASLVFLQGPLAIAATNIWTGKGDGTSFLNSDNWSTLEVVSSDTLKFVPRGSVALGIGSISALTVNLQGAATAFGIAVGDARSGAASSITITGGTLTLGSNGSDGIGFTDVGGSTRSLEISSALTVAAAQNINVNLADDSVVLSGSVSSAQGIANTRFLKAGLGSLVLSGNNSSFSGGVTVGAGKLALNSATALGSGSLEILGGSLDNTSGAPVVLTTNNVQAWNGDFAYAGTGGSTLNVGTGAVTLGENRTVTVAAGGLTVGGTIGGAYRLTKAGAGALTLSGANTYTGGLTLQAGQVNLNNGSAAGTGTLTISGGSIDNTSGSSITLTNAAQIWNGGFTFIGTGALNTGTGDITLSTGTILTIQAGVFTVGGELSGTASITKAGAGKLQLEAAAAYTGSTTVTGGTLSTNAANLLPNSTDVTIGAGATIQLGGAQTIESLSGSGNLVKLGALTLSNGSGNSFSGVLSGSGDVTLLEGTLTLAGTNTYSGITTLDSGATLKIANSAALGGTVDSTSISSGATLDLNGQTNVAESIDVRGTGNAVSGALINSAGSGASVTGVVKLWADSSIGGAGNITLSGGLIEDTQRNLTKVGVGTLTLDGPSTFTGTATVAAGVLKLANNNALGNGTSNASGVSVTSGASLDLNGTDPVSVALTINGPGVSSGGALANSAAGPATYAGDVTLGGAASIGGGIKLTGSIIGSQALTKVGAGLLVIEGAANAAASVAVSTGTVQVGNGSTLGTLGAASVSVADGAVLAFKRVDDYSGTVTNVISGSGNVTIASGTLTLGGANTYTGATSVLAGSLILGSTSALGASSGVSVATGALLDFGGNDATAKLNLDGRSASAAILTNSSATAVTSGGTVSLATGTTSAIGGLGDITLNGAVSGGTLAKVGANTLTLAVANTYGDTLISNGTLRIASAGSLGQGAVANNARLVFARSDVSTVSNSISGSGAVSVEAGTLTLTGANTYAGVTTVSAATLIIQGGITSDIALEAASLVNFSQSASSVYGGSLSGVGTFTKLGTGTLSLSGNSDLSNGTAVVSEGLLSIGTGGADGSLAGSITNNAAIQFNRTGTLSYNGTISGTGSVSNIGAGNVTLAGTQTYFGNTSVSAGSLTADVLLNTTAVDVSGTGTLTIGSINSAASLTVGGTGAVTVSGTGLTVGTLANNSTVATGLNFSAITGTITVGSLSGTGATRFGSDADITGTLSQGSISVVGLLTADDVTGGALNAGALTTSGTIGGGSITVGSGSAQLTRVNGGILALGGATNSVTELSGGTLSFSNAAANLTVAGGTQAQSGSISGTAKLISGGTLTLNGANTYTRGTDLTGGTLSVGGTSALGTGTLTVSSGASLAASGSGASIANQISLGGSLTFLGSNSLTAQGSLLLSADSTLNVAAQTLTLGGTIVAGGSALTKAGVGTLALTGTGSNVGLIINAGSVTAVTSALSSAGTVTTGSLGTFSLLGNQSIGSVYGSGSLLLGSSSLTLASGGSYTGVITGGTASFLNLNGGSLTISGTINAFGGTLSVTNDGTVDLAGTTQRVGTAILNGGTIQNGSLTFSNLTLSRGIYNAALSGSGVLTKDSTAATVSMGADNSAFTGSVVIQGGTLSLEGSTALAGTVAVSFSAVSGDSTLRVGTSSISLGALAGGSQGIVALGANTLTLQSTGSAIFGGSITSNAGTLVITGTGTQTLAGTLTGSLNTEVRSGILEVANAAALGSSANGIALSGGTLSLSASGTLAAAHNVTSTGTSSLVLGGSLNQVLGDLNVQGTLAVAGGSSGTIQRITFADTTLANATTLSVGSFASVTLGDLTGDYNLTKSGNGSLTLSGTNDSTKATTVTGGSLILASGGSLASGNLTLSGSATVVDLGVTSQTVAAGSFTNGTLRGGTLTATSFALNGATVFSRLTGAGSLTSDGNTNLNGQNDYTGSTSVSGGSLNIDSGGSISSTGSLIVSGSAYANFRGTDVTIGTISGFGTTAFSGTGRVTSNVSSGTINVVGNAFLADITGSAVTVGGSAAVGTLSSGSLTLNGAVSTQSTLTTMNGGALAVAANQTATIGTFTAGSASIGGALQVNSGTFAGTLSGTGSLSVLSGNDVTLNGTLTAFTGAYTVNAATLTIGTATSGAASLALVSGGTANLNFDGGSLGTVANAGRLALGGGTVTVGSLTGAGVVTTGSSATLKVGNTGGSAVFGGSITGGIALTKEGAGLFALTGSNNFTGTANVSAGTLSIGTGVNSGSVSSNISVASGAEVRFNRSDALAYEGTITGSGTLVQSGTGTTTLSGPNTYTGGTTVNQGTLVISGSLASLSSLEVKTAGRADLNYAGASLGTVANTGLLNFGSLTGTASVGTLSGTGTTGFSSNLNITNYTGAGTISMTTGSGTLSIGTLNGSGLTSLRGNATIGVLSAGSINLAAAGTLSVASGTYAGIISGTASLVKTGADTLVLSGANTYTELTTVNGGLLSVTGSLANNSNLTVSAGSAQFGAAATLGTVTNAGSLNFLAAVSLGSLTGTGITTFNASTNSVVGGVTVGTLRLLGGVTSLGAISGGGITVGSQATGSATTYVGATLTNAGSFSLGTLSGGSITNNGTLAVTTLTDGTIAGAGVINAGGGIFVGTISGNATLNASGVLKVGSSASVPTVSYGVSQGGSLTFEGSRSIGTLNNLGNVTFNGGSWLTQTGTGTVTVASGTLSVASGTGALSVNAGATARYTQNVSLTSVTNLGTLELAAGSRVGAISSTGTLTSAGLLTVSSGSITGFRSTIGGTASLTKIEGGSLVLSGVNTYTGPTTISGGTLSLATGATLPTGHVLSIGSGATLQLSGNTLELGQLSLSAGSIIGSGTLKVAMASYSASGVSNIGSDVLLELSFPPSPTSGLSFNQNQTVSNLVNTGTSVSVGAGTLLTVKGNVNAPTQTVAINSGTLSVAGGSVAVGTLQFGSFEAPGGSLQVMSPTTFTGVLQGSGVISGTSQISFGSGTRFDIGYSPGTLNLNAPALITAGTQSLNGLPVKFEYHVESIATGTLNSDRIVIGAGGTLRFAPGASFDLTVAKYSDTVGATQRITDNSAHAFPFVVLANGGTIETGSVAISSLFVNNASNSVVVVATPTQVSGGSVNMVVQRRTFASFGTGNVAAAGALMDRALTVTSGTISNLIDALDAKSSASDVKSTLAALDPGVYADLGNIGLDRLRDIQAGLANHIDMLALDAVGESTLSLAVKPGQTTAAAAVEHARAWTTGYGGWGKRSADSAVGSAGYSSNHFGDISGVETKVGGLTLGLLGAVGTSTADFENGRGKVTTDTWHAGFYGNLPAGAFVLDASFAYGQSEGNLKRTVNIAGGGATTGRTQGTEWTGQVGVAVPFRTESGSLVITPSLHLIHANVKQDGLTESSLNGLEAVVKGNTTKSTAVRTGVQAAKITKLASKTTRLTASLDWVHSFDSGTSDVDIALQGAGAATSRFQGSRSSKDAIRIGLGAEVALTERTRFRLNVDEQIRSGMQSTFGSASVGYQF